MGNWITNTLSQYKAYQIKKSDELTASEAYADKANIDTKSWLATTWLGRIFRYVGRMIYGTANADNRKTSEVVLERFGHRMNPALKSVLESRKIGENPISVRLISQVSKEAHGLDDQYNWSAGQRPTSSIVSDDELTTYKEQGDMHFLKKEYNTNQRIQFIHARKEIYEALKANEADIPKKLEALRDKLVEGANKVFRMQDKPNLEVENNDIPGKVNNYLTHGNDDAFEDLSSSVDFYLCKNLVPNKTGKNKAEDSNPERREKVPGNNPADSRHPPRLRVEVQVDMEVEKKVQDDPEASHDPPSIQEDEKVQNQLARDYLDDASLLLADIEATKNRDYLPNDYITTRKNKLMKATGMVAKSSAEKTQAKN